ncbi:Bug family tripartite tricarboxylate transporter substrate binding protein [Roseinatronobacter bogoriensis]|uniref:Tripartite tricarboxylate transporter substrate binding protein n=1 Tax=Roseinatronobacter bogoriensis subsp. barguzinensis TaxID=441209 RepID=A0A2K8KDK4_9RHOB|nr:MULTISPECIES: tripartite tricarboxylate transporter substrate binding protein [Rhodobaca]ATX64838.1 tripartite tricarboxylate transporter substrate binding protein [Rhodobaca barguzinensis]MBB4208630.1 tripartite-type tricarboxylate transporter receptor subunit TctC [Rhodobaca bogoriensis DSM 18756]TDW38102.1 tripartite-type tricarboxylate transporter receptor subunit TctC [Rhodobaca barguzinensis]TDY69728.1 tripartite-type tricarboxylate transporter receptor subunit TctC [Rhodobaca bogorien
MSLKSASSKGLFVGVVAAFAASAPVLAQDFPSRAIEYIIPFDPGGESDITARLQEPLMQEALGVNVNVRHQPGGGGAVAWSDFQSNAEPDGHEIIGINTPHIVAQPIQRADAGYTTDGFDIITWFHLTPHVVVVRADSPFETLEDLIEFAGENPQSLTMGGSGTFTGNHLETLRLMELADIRVTYIPFTGTGPLPAAILGGHVGAVMSNATLAVEMGDNVRVLAVASEERLETLPDVPTFLELGYDVVGGTYRGVAVPNGTPADRVEMLADLFAQMNETLGERQIPMGYQMTDIRGQDAIDLMTRMREQYGDFLN